MKEMTTVPAYGINVRLLREPTEDLNSRVEGWSNLADKNELYYFNHFIDSKLEYKIVEVSTGIKLYADVDSLNGKDLVKLQDFINKNVDKYDEIVSSSQHVKADNVDDFIDTLTNNIL